MSMTEIASHRGGAFLWPENSLLAFRHALAWPAEQLEFDVHASAEGEPIVIHDATLDRTTDHRGAVCEHSWAELQQMRLRGTGGETVPHLAQVAALVGPTRQRLRLEIKADAQGRPYPGLTQRCAGLLDGSGLRGRTILMSFEAATVAEGAALAGFEQLVFLADRRRLAGMRAEDAVAAALGCGASELGVHEASADARLRDALREAGLRLSVWGANHAPAIHRALVLGVDVLATDDPPLAIELRRQFAKALRGAGAPS